MSTQPQKHHPSRKYKTSKYSKKYIYSIRLLSIVGLLLALLSFGYVQFQAQSMSSEKNSSIVFENTIPLLAVGENREGEIVSSSQIPLRLKIVEGDGNVFVNLNSFSELDTQISITNSHYTVCTLLQLNCNSFDFYYTFEDASLVLKGPSASTSIAALTYATLNFIEIDNSFALTGSLNTNGVIGVVGGIDEKVNLASNLNFETVYVPFNSVSSELRDEIESTSSLSIVEDFDIISVLQDIFPEEQESLMLPLEEFSTDDYTDVMRFIGSELCEISQDYITQLESYNTTNSTLVENSNEQYNYSNQAFESGEFYSQGSFCYSANLGFKTYLNQQELESIDDIQYEIRQINTSIQSKKKKYDPIVYPQTLTTLNDIFVYLLVSDRIAQSSNFMESAQERIDTYENRSLNDSVSEEQLNSLKNQATQQLSFAQERFTTIEQWEEVFDSTSSQQTRLSHSRAREICQLYISQTQVSEQLLQQYSIDVLSDEIDELSELLDDHPYRCIYSGMDLKGRINTMFLGAENSNQTLVNTALEELQMIAMSRMEFKSQGEVPLIPYVSYEYSKSLQEIGNSQSAILYVNNALAFSELNILLSNQPSSTTDEISSSLLKYQQQKLSEQSSIQQYSYLFIVLALGFMAYLLFY
ncbi:MAG: S16 family serine protease [Candidatus Nanoarchaeia archaeon]